MQNEDAESEIKEVLTINKITFYTHLRLGLKFKFTL